MDSWERLDQECCRKQKEVAEAIKHEKKLKSQNSFVLKENFMLKEQLAAVQEIADKPDKQEKKIGASRKKVKLNAICEE